MTTDDWKLLGEIIGTPGHWQQFTQHDHNKKAATLQKQALARLKALVRPAKREVLGLQDVVTASGKDLARTGSSGAATNLGSARAMGSHLATWCFHKI